MARKRRSDFTPLEIAQGKMPRLEKQVEHAGDRFMAGMGFDSIHFSQSRATMQTPGIPDRKYYNAERGVTAWWEAKREDGRQTEAEWNYQQMAEACGEAYLLGTEDVLVAWCQRGCKPGSAWIENLVQSESAIYQPEQFRHRRPKHRRSA